MAPSKLQKLQKLLSGTFSATLPAAFDGLSLLCHGSSRGPTSCFCWASKLLSGTSEAPQAVSIGFRNCYLARFQRPLKASKPSKPSQQPSTAFRCFAMGPPEAPQAVSVGLRKCYLTLPRRHKLFLLGFETAIWHVAAFDGHSLLCHGSSRGPTSCFCWASKLLSGTSEAPQAVSIGLQNCYLARLQPPLKSLKTLPAAFDGLSLLCHGSSRGPTSCFCWASKMLSDTSEAPQAVCIGLRNCYLARFQHPLKASKPSKPSKPSQQLSTAFAALPWVLPRPHELFLLGFETAIWPFRSATRCFYWVSKLLSGTFSAPLKSLKTIKTVETFAAAFDGLSLLCHGTSRGPTSCFCWAWKLLSGTSEAPQAVSIGLRNCYLARFQRPLKASKPSQQLSTAFRCFAMGPPEAPRAVSVGLRNCYLALPRRDKLFLLGFETAIWHVAAFDGLSLLCHGSSRGPTSCFCWASKLLSGTSEAPQAVSIYWASKLLSGTFSAPLKASKPSQQLSTAFRCFAMGPPEAPRTVSVGLRNCYLARFQHPLKASKPSKPSQQLSTAFRCFAMGPPRRHKLFLLGVENAIWHVAAFDGHSLLCHGSSRGPTSCFCWASKLLSGTSEVPQAVSIRLRNCYLARCSFRRPFAALPWVLPRPHKLFLLGFETAIWPVGSGPHLRTRFLAHVRTRKQASPEHAFLVSRAHAQDAFLVSRAHAQEFVGSGGGG